MWLLFFRGSPLQALDLLNKTKGKTGPYVACVTADTVVIAACMLDVAMFILNARRCVSIQSGFAVMKQCVLHVKKNSCATPSVKNVHNYSYELFYWHLLDLVKSSF